MEVSKKKSIVLNAVLNITRTLLALVAPIITYPYVSRKLGASNLGSVNFTNSIVQYFVILSGLGISTYGIREGSKRRDNPYRLSSFVNECFTINVIFTVVSYIGFIFVLVYYSDNNVYFKLFCIQSFLILFSTIGVEWINNVFEDYLYITIRTIFVQLLSIFLTFLLIHDRSDYIIYAVVVTVTNGAVSILNWLRYRKLIKIRLTRKINLSEHFKSIFTFFANKLAVTLYVSADTTMLGVMVGDYSVGIYSVAVKVYTIVKNLLASIYSVFIPRLSYFIGKDDKTSFKKMYSDLISVMTLLIVPAAIGLLLLCKEIIILLFGKEYSEAYIPLAILSIAVIFAIYGGLVSAVYDVTMGLEKIALQSTIIAAIANIISNLIFLPLFKETGAAITTALAELLTLLYCLLRSANISDFICFRKVLKSIIHAIIGGIEITIIVTLVQSVFNSLILICMLSILFGIFVYLVTLVALKNPYVFDFIEMIRRITVKKGEIE